MVGFAAVSGRVSRPKGNTEAAQADAPEFEHVNWRTQPNMKKRQYTQQHELLLYFLTTS